MKNKDEMTGLPNGTVLNVVLNSAISSEQDIALALLDIDNFSRINESLGPVKGDQVIASIASILKNEFPADAYRISGDEFAVAMPDATLEQAFLRMESLRKTIENDGKLQSCSKNSLPPITVTIGVAQFPRDAKQQSALSKAADAALLSAKEQRRNSVGLPPSEEMISKSCYYPAASVRKLKALSEQKKLKESVLLREALADLLRKYDAPNSVRAAH